MDVLVVEDEVILAMHMEAILNDSGSRGYRRRNDSI
jgi:hypothetical protein